MKFKKIALFGLGMLMVIIGCKTEVKKETSFLPNLEEELRNNQEKGKLIFTFASLAYNIDADWGKGVPATGMERIAKVAHKHDIPVTWIINPGSGKIMKNKLNEWHNKYGDDIAFVWHDDFEKDGIDFKKTADTLKNLFAWSKVEVFAGKRENEMFLRSKKAGASAIWGSCWEQVGIDGITDRGTPWGFFYASDDNYKLPALNGDGIVSVEWTSRDLLKSLHAQAPTIYSSDPNDVGRTGLCTGEDISYWKTFFDNYLRNIAHNKFVFFQQQQEAHEMEYGDVCKAYSPEEIDEAEKMLDAFFTYVKSYGDLVEYKTIPEAVQVYKNSFAETEPSVMLFDDAPARKPEFWYARGYGAFGPWPKTLLYYDKECQLAFIENQLIPVMHRDYVHNREVNDPNYYVANYSPAIKVRTPWKRNIEITEIPIEITSDREMPYALSLWYDFNRFKIKKIDGAKYFGPVENQVLLLRLNLEKGVNKILVQLDTTDKL
jgi:hypothetical protein